MIKKCLYDAKQIKNAEKIICRECTYVQKDKNKIDEIIDLPPDNEHTISASYFNEEPIVGVQTII